MLLIEGVVGRMKALLLFANVGIAEACLKEIGVDDVSLESVDGVGFKTW